MYQLHEEERIGWADMIALSFDYGQRHNKELDVASELARAVGVDHYVIELLTTVMKDEEGYHLGQASRLGALLGSSALTDSSVPVPDGHYAEDTMKATIVPNRNAIMLSIAYGVAVARGAELVAFAAHSGDHAIYPDCRPEFVEGLDEALRTGNAWADPLPKLIAPFLFVDKAEIARRAVRYNVPIEKTWSCYKGGEIHCGTCGTCYERREAFQLAEVKDPTRYLDNTTVFAAPSA
jgi:7-cyano-7-deazaguanine synthase